MMRDCSQWSHLLTSPPYLASYDFSASSCNSGVKSSAQICTNLVLLSCKSNKSKKKTCCMEQSFYQVIKGTLISLKVQKPAQSQNQETLCRDTGSPFKRLVLTELERWLVRLVDALHIRCPARTARALIGPTRIYPAYWMKRGPAASRRAESMLIGLVSQERLRRTAWLHADQSERREKIATQKWRVRETRRQVLISAVHLIKHTTTLIKSLQD